MRLYLGNLKYLESIEIRRYCAQNLSVGSSVYRRLRKVICEKLLFMCSSLMSIGPPAYLSVCPSVCSHGTTRLLYDGYSWKYCTGNFYDNSSRPSSFV